MATQASGAAATSAATDSSGSHGGYSGSQPSFSYGSAQSQQQQQQPQPAAGSVMQSQQPPPASPVGPSFSYNISQPAVGFQGNQHFQPSMATHPNSYAPAKSMPPPAPILTGASSTASSFSFNGNPQLMQKDQSFKINTSTTVSQGATTSSFMPTFSQPVPMPAHTSQMTTMPPSAPNLGPATSMVTTAPSFSVPPGMPGTPGIPGPPGLAASAPISSNLTVSSSATESSSIALRPSLLTTAQLNPAVQQQIYPQYPSLPSMNPFTQGSWLQPPQLGGVPRPPFLPYPSAYPGSYPMPARGMPLPSVPLPDSQPPGVTPVGSAGALHMSSASSGHQLASSSTMQAEVTPPGTDNGKQYTKDETAGEHLDAWTAHKTDTGVVYYYNALTGVSTYEKPPGFKGEAERVTAAPTSVSVENLVSSDWALVTTNDGKKFYYNNKTKLSSWQMPSEVAELKKQQEVDVLKEHSMPVSNTSVVAEKGTTSVSLNAPILNTGGRDAIALRTSSMPGSSSALDLIKKKLQDSGAPVSPSVPALSGTSSELNGSRAVEAAVKGLHTENSKDKLRDSNGDGNMSDSSSDSEDADSGPTKEECIVQFKEMLKERGVAPFSKWEKELPKIVFDPRFKAIPSYSARRSIFEHYVKTRAEEERKEKRAAQKAAIERFKQLLDEAMEDIDHNTNYQTFRKKWGNDPRFETLDRKDRELLLNERVLPLKRVVDEKVRAERAATAASFKSMLKEKGDVNVNSRWSRVKDGLRNDPRYKLVKHEDREILFNEYVSELKAAEQEAEQEAKNKRDEQEKLKEREREFRKRKEREEHEMERVRLKVRRKEAVSSFQALLVETIKDPQASWTESKLKLEKDPQRRASNPDLDPSDTEKLFREHIKMLYERCANDFRALLTDVLTTEAASQETEDGKTVLSSWSTAKRLLKPDPRYNKMPRKDREALWRRYADDMLRKQQKSAQNQKEEKLSDAKTKHSVDSGSRYSSGTRKASDRR